MKDKSTISVIVPVYNAEKSLKECIESIIEQTYKNLEIIIIDDGSNDNSGKISEDFAKIDKRIKVVRQRNMGPSSARNKGLNIATGDYIQFVDSDDKIVKDMCEILLKQMVKDVELTICGYSINERPNSNTKVHDRVPTVSGFFYFTSFIKNFGELFHGRVINSNCNKLYRSEVIQKNDICFSDRLDMGEDLLFNLCYIKSMRGGVKVIEDELYEYNNYNDDSLTRQYKKEYFQNQKMLFLLVKEFLIDLDGYDKTNRFYNEWKFSQCIVDSLGNLFHKNSELDKKNIIDAIQSIVNDQEVTYNKMRYLQGSSYQQCFIAKLINKKSLTSIYYFFKIKTKIKSLTHYFKKIETN
ncbi:MAG: glycosyltransferase [Staphylococcus equorum]|uniref:glycosyltransferase family 2 protein n=1 Tax=Tetragenococcus koreensis TaxID=290335 RepID=UPI001F3876AF|nr:glycosyltransferase family 2 protein [Tetragenococcus koreensis]MDN6570788.1 glycosyltransferase [Staphylococcus equorum]MCF1617098.1 glycosyltransferase [Tetragenococcus koreensis]MCF1621971.1 glycosyltransferase [Tetragenococcus koreensis]MCF1641814.1 glycosyltransferase [Tetragenococcus koreensis]MCF1678040.1 glycosyltransferase [Tetragenococcus koreensis]